MAATQVELVTPSSTLYSGRAEMVVCRTHGGDIAFLADHIACLGLLEPCTLRIVGPEAGPASGAQGTAERPDDELRFNVEGGIVEVRDNWVVVACTSAERAGTSAERAG